MFESNLKFSRAAYWVNSKTSNRDSEYHTHDILMLPLFSGHCYAVTIKGL